MVAAVRHWGSRLEFNKLFAAGEAPICRCRNGPCYYYHCMRDVLCCIISVRVSSTPTTTSIRFIYTLFMFKVGQNSERNKQQHQVSVVVLLNTRARDTSKTNITVAEITRSLFAPDCCRLAVAAKSEGQTNLCLSDIKTARTDDVRWSCCCCVFLC